MNEQLGQFERNIAWVAREYLRLIRLRQTAAVRHALGELHQRSGQIKREFNRFQECHQVTLPEPSAFGDTPRGDAGTSPGGGQTPS